MKLRQLKRAIELLEEGPNFSGIEQVIRSSFKNKEDYFAAEENRIREVDSRIDDFLDQNVEDL